MVDPLRVRRTPHELAARSQCIEFSEKISVFEAIAEALGKDLAVLDAARMPAGWQDAEVAGWLRFGFADARESLPAVEGQVAATVDAVCQRCLEPFRLPLRAEVRLLFAREAPDMHSHDDWEVWETAEAQLCPLQLVDEVLVMALPLVAKHADDAVCRTERTDTAEAVAGTRPFAGLKARLEGE